LGAHILDVLGRPVTAITVTAALVAQGLGSDATLVNFEQALACAEAHALTLDGAAP
jgi:hypothetical protein